MSEKIKLLCQRQDELLSHLVSSQFIPAPRIRSAMEYVITSGGKRIRPLLVYLCGELLHVPINILDIIATSVEITHCYSLVHDDLPAMDDDDYRRGKLSCHKAYDEATAILVGDGLQALAIENLVSQLPAFLPCGKVVAITLHLTKASGVCGMVSGQSLDLTELNNPLLTEKHLANIHQLKTGKLIAACIEMVMVASEITLAEKESLTKFAESLGLLFQMQDDFLDQYANASLGKKRSSDQANNKITYAGLFSSEELLHKIHSLHNHTLNCLQLYKPRSDELIALIESLLQRTNLTALP
jgi:farnesyl diphosphate synthase